MLFVNFKLKQLIYFAMISHHLGKIWVQASLKYDVGIFIRDNEEDTRVM